MLQVDEYGFPIRTSRHCFKRVFEESDNVMKFQAASIPGLFSVYVVVYGFMIFKYYDLKNFVEQLNSLSAHQQHIYSQMKSVYRCLIRQLLLLIFYPITAILHLKALEYGDMAGNHLMRFVRFSVAIGVAMSPREYIFE